MTRVLGFYYEFENIYAQLFPLRLIFQFYQKSFIIEIIFK